MYPVSQHVPQRHQLLNSISEIAGGASDGVQTLQSVFDRQRFLAVLADPSGRILIFNDFAESVTGYKREEVIGKNILELFVPAEWVPAVVRRFSDPFSNELREPHRNPWIAKDGSELSIEWVCAAVRVKSFDQPCIAGAGMCAPAHS
jgi:PAS domain S-box-containing protein